MLTQARLVFYVSTALTGGAVVLSMLGAADYDAASGMLDIHPIDLKYAAVMIAGPISAALAAVAVWLGWGRK